MVFKVSDSDQVAQEHTVKPHFNRPVIVIVALIAALITGFFIVSRSAADNKTKPQHVFQADAARYSALAAYYVAKDEANQRRAIEAETARYNGLVKFYSTENKTSQEVQKELEAADKEIATLQNQQMRLNLLHQFQQKDVTRAHATGFVTGNTQPTKNGQGH